MGQFFLAKKITMELCADKFNAFNFQDVQLKETTGKPKSYDNKQKEKKFVMK